MNNSSLEIKNQEIPFASLLNNFEEQLYIFENEENKTSLAKLRWYQYDEENNISNDLDNSLSLNKYFIFFNLFRKFSSIMLLDDLDNIKYTPLNLTFNLIAEILKKYENNSVLNFFTSFIYSLTYFCKLNYKIILNCYHDDNIFLNEYIKRVY